MTLSERLEKPLSEEEGANRRAERKGDRLLPVLMVERGWGRHVWTVVGWVIAGLFACVVFGFWAPADGGVDQNAYLVGGRMIAEHYSPRLDLAHPFSFVGSMFIRLDNGSYYPKYPFGLPLLYAVVFWIFGAGKAVTLAFLVSPIGAVSAVLGMFYLGRIVAGPFAAAMAAILLGTSQIMLAYADNPNSHASCVACGVWGMFFLVRWWQSGGIWRGALAGFLLGYACLIRYSEGLLIVPIVVAVLFRMRWGEWRSYFRNAVPVLVWGMVVGALLYFNKHNMGTWTGYDSTNESEFGEAFTWGKLSTTWEQMLRTLYDTGLFFVFPIGIAGMGMLVRKNAGLGLMVLAWFLPGVALYTSYYFSPDAGLSYARFFLTFLPAVLVGVAVCFQDGIMKSGEGGGWWGRFSLAMTVGVVTAIGAGVGTYRSVVGMEGGRADAAGLVTSYLERENLASAGRVLAEHVPNGSTLFAGSSGMVRSAINYIQFVGDWRLFTVNRFTPAGGRKFGGGMFNNGDPNGPTVMQKKERDYESALYDKYNGAQLRVEEGHVVDEALGSGKRVFVASTPEDVASFENNLLNRAGYRFMKVALWSDEVDADPIVVPVTNGIGGRRGGPVQVGVAGLLGGLGANVASTRWVLVEVMKVAPKKVGN